MQSRARKGVSVEKYGGGSIKAENPLGTTRTGGPVGIDLVRPLSCSNNWHLLSVPLGKKLDCFQPL